MKPAPIKAVLHLRRRTTITLLNPIRSCRPINQITTSFSQPRYSAPQSPQRARVFTKALCQTMTIRHAGLIRRDKKKSYGYGNLLQVRLPEIRGATRLSELQYHPKYQQRICVSLALSNHLSSKEQLVQYSSELRSGKKLSVPREALVQALDALKDPQLLAMLGAQPAVSETAQPSPPPRSAPQQSQTSPTSRSTNASIAVLGESVLTLNGTLRDAVGIETLGSKFTMILAKGSRLPCAASQIFSTGEDGQNQITLHLCCGDSASSKITQQLGRFEISGIPPMPKGQPSILVEFRAELTGISLKASDNSVKSTLAIRRVPSPSTPAPQAQTRRQPQVVSTRPPKISRNTASPQPRCISRRSRSWA